MAKQTFMSRVKAYRKLHPRCSQVEAMKKLKGTTISGTRKKKKVAAPVKHKSVAGTKSKAMGSVKHKTKRVTRKVGAIGSIKRAESLIKQIDKLEAKRKSIKHRELRDIVQLEINAKHDQLKAIKAACRRKSA